MILSSEELLARGHTITTIRVQSDSMQLTKINLYLVSAQFRDDDLPPLRYGANHTLVVKSLNNSRGDLPFMTHSDEVGDTRIKMVFWTDLLAMFDDVHNRT